MQNTRDFNIGPGHPEEHFSLRWTLKEHSSITVQQNALRNVPLILRNGINDVIKYEWSDRTSACHYKLSSEDLTIIFCTKSAWFTINAIDLDKLFLTAVSSIFTATTYLLPLYHDEYTHVEWLNFHISPNIAWTKLGCHVFKKVAKRGAKFLQFPSSVFIGNHYMY